MVLVLVHLRRSALHALVYAWDTVDNDRKSELVRSSYSKSLTGKGDADEKEEEEEERETHRESERGGE